VIDNGYVSISKHQGTAIGFGSNGKVAKISVAKGCKAMDIHKISHHPGEHEVLLPRGSMFRVDKISGDTVELTYVCG